METKVRKSTRGTNTELKKQLAAILKGWFAAELPASKNRHRRSGHGAPLSAWMLGTPKGCRSKIMAVDSNQAWYPYHAIGDGAKVLASRIANRYQVTWVQHARIEHYVLSCYRGRMSTSWHPSLRGPLHDVISPFDARRTCAMEPLLEAACVRIGKSVYDLPLGALIDPRVTNILLLAELDSTTRRK